MENSETRNCAAEIVLPRGRSLKSLPAPTINPVYSLPQKGVLFQSLRVFFFAWDRIPPPDIPETTLYGPRCLTPRKKTNQTSLPAMVSASGVLTGPGGPKYNIPEIRISGPHVGGTPESYRNDLPALPETLPAGRRDAECLTALSRPVSSVRSENGFA